MNNICMPWVQDAYKNERTFNVFYMYSSFIKDNKDTQDTVILVNFSP